jgi:hypothetical protein
MHIPHFLDTCLTSPRPHQWHDPLYHVLTLVCPMCQPPRLVTWLLWSLSQVPALILRCYRSIGTNMHDLHLRHGPPYLCSTPARGGHIFTINQKSNRTVPNQNFGFFGSSVRFRFLYLRSSVFGIVIGFHRIPNRKKRIPNFINSQIWLFDYVN